MALLAAESFHEGKESSATKDTLLMASAIMAAAENLSNSLRVTSMSHVSVSGSFVKFTSADNCRLLQDETQVLGY